jgi:uncharacterized membrane protein
LIDTLDAKPTSEGIYVDASEPYSTPGRLHAYGLHPIHGILLASGVPLFLGALLGDLAYAYSYHIQWSNFASWLIAGGLVLSGLTLLWGLINLITGHRARHYCWYVLLMAITWVGGLFNALIHARDAWAMMPHGLVLSAIVLVLACITAGIGFVRFGVGCPGKGDQR